MWRHLLRPTHNAFTFVALLLISHIELFAAVINDAISMVARTCGLHWQQQLLAMRQPQTGAEPQAQDASQSLHEN